jgi:hypothetical protein
VLCERRISAVDPQNRRSAPGVVRPAATASCSGSNPVIGDPIPRSGIIALATVEPTKTLNDTVRVWPSRAHLRSPGGQSPEIARDGEKRAPIRAIDRGAIRRDADRAASGGLPPLCTRSRITQGHRRQ